MTATLQAMTQNNQDKMDTNLKGTRASQEHLKAEMRASQKLLKEEMLAKMETNQERMNVKTDGNQEKMEATIDGNNEKSEALRSTLISHMNIHQARTEAVQK
jgi:hypothetical protein